MQRSASRNVALAAAFTIAVATAWQAWAANDRVQFPASYAEGVHYATVNRGGIREEIFTSREAIDAAKAGRPMPAGTVIAMEDYRSGRLYRYVVMEKRDGWGSVQPMFAMATGEYREFAPDRSPNMNENGQRCMSCHLGQASNDFIWTYDRLKSAP